MKPAQPDPDPVGMGRRFHLAVQPGCECPKCKEWSMDLLVWIDDDTVECATCGTRYQPATGKVVGTADNPPAGGGTPDDGS